MPVNAHDPRHGITVPGSLFSLSGTLSRPTRKASAGQIGSRHDASGSALTSLLRQLSSISLTWIDPPREALKSTFTLLETECSQDAEAAEFIGNWFVRYLPNPDAPGAETVAWLGPCLRAEYDRTRREDAYETPESTIAFVHGLAALAPPLADELREHLADGYSPHLFVSEVTDKIIEKYVEAAAVGSGLPEQERALLDFMEHEYGKDRDVDNMIDLYVIEHLPYPPDLGAGIVDLLGRKLTAELRRQRS